jgi:hypothetical protein
MKTVNNPLATHNEVAPDRNCAFCDAEIPDAMLESEETAFPWGGAAHPKPTFRLDCRRYAPLDLPPA